MESSSLDNKHLLPAPLKESRRRQKLGFIVGIVGNIISVLVFLSPIDTFWRILNDKSTEDFDSIPYICTLLNTSLWIYYGLTEPDSILVATVNGFGFVVEAVYIIIFVIFAVNYIRIQIVVLVGIEVVFFLAVFFGTSARRMQRDQRVRVIGAIAAVVNVLMYSSPLAAMRTVLITGSVEYMPFFLSFFLLLNGGVWAFYAFLFRDLWVGIPNGIGFVLGAAQIVIYNIFKLRVLKEGGQHEQFL